MSGRLRTPSVYIMADLVFNIRRDFAVNRTALLLCLVAALSVGLVGCGGGASGPNTAAVKGTLSINGAPANDIQITFMPSDATGVAASGTVKNGQFELFTTGGKRGAVPGKYKVVLVAAAAMPGSPAGGSAPPSSDAMMSKYKSAKGKTPGSDEKPPFPEKYKSAATSDKEVEVKSGSNDIKIEI